MVHTTGRQRGSKRELGTGMLTGSDHRPRPPPPPRPMGTLGFSTEFELTRCLVSPAILLDDLSSAVAYCSNTRLVSGLIEAESGSHLLAFPQHAQHATACERSWI